MKSFFHDLSLHFDVSSLSSGSLTRGRADRAVLMQVTQVLVRPFPGVGLQTPFGRGDLDTSLMNAITFKLVD